MSKKKSKPDIKKNEKNILSRFTEIIKTRWKFIVSLYFLGYGWSFFDTGVPNLYYLIPIKVFAVIFGWALGNSLYDGTKRPYYQMGYYCAIHSITGVFLGGIAFLLITVVCWLLDIDPVPFYGVE